MNLALGIEIAWYVTCLSMLALYWASHRWPKRVLWLQSNPWAFQADKMNDLEFQSVLYAAYHTRPFSQITHLSVVPDQFAWFTLLALWSPWVVGLALLGLAVQAHRLREPSLYVPLALAWVGVAVGGYWLAQTLPEARMLAMAVLMAGGLIRMIGHAVEPLPPGLGGTGNRFTPLHRSRIRLPILVAVGAAGYISEFSSGLPWRLFPVQVSWLAQALGIRPRNLPTWALIRRRGLDAQKNGWGKAGGVGKMFREDRRSA